MRSMSASSIISGGQNSIESATPRTITPASTMASRTTIESALLGSRAAQTAPWPDSTLASIVLGDAVGDQSIKAGGETGADIVRSGHEPLAFDDVDVGQRGRAGRRVAVVGVAVAEDVVEVILGANAHNLDLVGVLLSKLLNRGTFPPARRSMWGPEPQ
jgi:hypothetical protein